MRASVNYEEASYLPLKKPTDFYSAPQPQGAVGSAPIYYIDQELPSGHGPYGPSLACIPGSGKRMLDRSEVRTVCRDSRVHPLVAYACIMAWGGRNFFNYRASLAGKNAAKVVKLVNSLRGGSKNREDDYDFTQKAAKGISGLGISFYTKLLFFLRADADAYILDQWTAKSAAVLFPRVGIKLTSAGMPHPETKPKKYGDFCKAIEGCVGPDGWGAAWTNGESVERTLFDRPRGPWRNWLKSNCKFKAAGEKLQPKAQAGGARALPPAPPIAPPGFPPPPNPLGGEGTAQAFAEFLRNVYLANVDAGVDLPQGMGGFNAPNRLHVIAHGCVTWQFIINQNEVRAQIFFGPACVGIYDNVIVPALNPQEEDGRHQFIGRIYGNGPAGGQNRAIDHPAVLIGGRESPFADWPYICQSAVEAMHQLFEVFEAHCQ